MIQAKQICTMAAGDLQAGFLVARGMLGVSLRHRGEELLRQVHDIEECARHGRTAGIPLLYPWANRLAQPRYCAAGKEVALDPASPLLHTDRFGLLNHGVPWPHLEWALERHEPQRIAAELAWDRAAWLAVFPFRHRLEIVAELSPSALTIATHVFAHEPMPVSFGFHPYLGIPGLARAAWELELPPMRELVLDAHKIPTGEERPFAAFDGPLADLDLDAGFALPAGARSFAVRGNGRRIAVERDESFPYLQLFAPRRQDLIAIEPMTAPANALVSGRNLPLLAAGESFRAVFRIRVEAA
jgi:aldose 1-epimerase